MAATRFLYFSDLLTVNLYFVKRVFLVFWNISEFYKKHICHILKYVQNALYKNKVCEGWLQRTFCISVFYKKCISCKYQICTKCIAQEQCVWEMAATEVATSLISLLLLHLYFPNLPFCIFVFIWFVKSAFEICPFTS